MGLGGLATLCLFIYLLKSFFARLGVCSAPWGIMASFVAFFFIALYLFIQVPSAKEEWYLGLALDPSLG